MTCLDRWQHLPRICLALVSLFACLFATEAHGLGLAQEGKTDYHIYIEASAAPAERYAARELAAFLKQATGATFPIVHTREAAGPLLVVGVNDLTKETLGTRPESGLLGDDGFEIRTRGDHLFVFGGSPRGTL
ncbi:MAG: alpha-glucuronidase family glycosyl hydrolase, partial [Gammaproteobacteria bacterium]